ncbi:MAG: MFS transporter [Leptolyngbyaceae cyanobacterium bins.59]|nr:MFS transporter [Leptolyngbyaceae cyanobacterium bins.59]
MSRTFWIIALIAFINSLSFTILIPTIYLYGRQFGLNDFQTSLLFATYSVAQFFATPVIGKLADRFGRKPLLVISLAGTVVANLIAGLAPFAWVLFAARFLDGITGGNASVAQAVISDVTDPANRAKGFGIFGAAFGLGFVMGPVISLLAQKISLGASFLASSGIALIAFVLTIALLPETLPRRSPEPHNLFDIGLGNLVTGLFMPRIGILLIINFLIGTTFTIFTYAFQPYFVYVLGQNSQALTLMFILFGTVGLVMQAKVLPFLNRKFSLNRVFFAALLVRSFSFILMPLWASMPYFVGVSVVFSILNPLVQPIVNTLISLNARSEDQGMAMGLNSSYLSVSNAVGPVIAGMVVHSDRPLTYSYPLYLAGGLTFLVLLLAINTRAQYAIPQSHPSDVS